MNRLHELSYYLLIFYFDLFEFNLLYGPYQVYKIALQLSLQGKTK